MLNFLRSGIVEKPQPPLSLDGFLAEAESRDCAATVWRRATPYRRGLPDDTEMELPRPRDAVDARELALEVGDEALAEQRAGLEADLKAAKRAAADDGRPARGLARSPAGREGEVFGLYATTGRAVSFLAPAMFAIFVAVGGAPARTKETSAELNNLIASAVEGKGVCGAWVRRF